MLVASFGETDARALVHNLYGNGNAGAAENRQCDAIVGSTSFLQLRQRPNTGPSVLHTAKGHGVLTEWTKVVAENVNVVPPFGGPSVPVHA